MKLTLDHFLDSLSIDSATDNTFRKIIGEGHDSVDKILSLSEEQISKVGRSKNRVVGSKRAVKIFVSLHSERVLSCLEYADKWVKGPSEKTESIFKIDLSGKKVCFTGKAPISRKELKQFIIDAGANPQSGVSGTTDILLIEDVDSKSGKAKKARELGTTILPYTEVL